MLKNTLVKLAAFCLILVAIRILRTGHFSFVFLFWNLFLAWLPYYIIGFYNRQNKALWKWLIICATLLFLPNAPYILTDLFHLTKKLVAPMWFDLVLIYSFSLLGLVFFLLTVEKLLRILKPMFAREWLFNLVKPFIFLSNGYGIYAGRYLRLNSWDLIYNPGVLAKRMFVSVFDTSDYKETFAITITFSIFLYLVFGIYETLVQKTLNDGQKNEISETTV